LSVGCRTCRETTESRSWRRRYESPRC